MRTSFDWIDALTGSHTISPPRPASPARLSSAHCSSDRSCRSRASGADRHRITEPAPSITYGLEPVTRAGGNAPLCARTAALDAVTLLAFTELLPPGGRVAVLGWQHTSRWWRPDRQAHRP